MTKLLVAAGYLYFRENKVEIVNLDEDNPDLICDDLPEIPVGNAGETGQLLMGKLPIICGGIKNECNCHQFQNDSWKPTPNPDYCRKHASSAILKIDDKKEVLVIAGGVDETETETFRKVETFDGIVWGNQSIANLPEAVSYSCMVKINSSRLLSIGGLGKSLNSYSGKTYFYDLRSNKWTTGPAIKTARNGLSCGLLTWNNAELNQTEKVVVIAGGQNDGRYLDSVELLYLNEDGTHNQSWVNGPDLPLRVYGSRMVEYNNTVILVGGDNPDAQQLYQLFSPKGPWIKMKQFLKTTRWFHAAFLVPDEIVNCHK